MVIFFHSPSLSKNPSSPRRLFAKCLILFALQTLHGALATRRRLFLAVVPRPVPTVSRLSQLTVKRKKNGDSYEHHGDNYMNYGLFPWIPWLFINYSSFIDDKLMMIYRTRKW